ncbi:MAG: hypothetical protein PUB86_07195 [Elusimicrobia bacterium]|nr:hypothetical protein [Elusimicrobiota bacterium]
MANTETTKRVKIAEETYKQIDPNKETPFWKTSAWQFIFAFLTMFITIILYAVQITKSYATLETQVHEMKEQISKIDNRINQTTNDIHIIDKEVAVLETKIKNPKE